MRFKGDIQVVSSGIDDYDINFELGQPVMTEGFDSYIYFAVYGDKYTWQNLLAESAGGKIITDFPDVVNAAAVSEETKNDGTAAIKRALEAMVADHIAAAITVTGKIVSAYMIAWNIEITRPDETKETYSVEYSKNWKSYEGDAKW